MGDSKYLQVSANRSCSSRMSTHSIGFRLVLPRKATHTKLNGIFTYLEKRQSKVSLVIVSSERQSSMASGPHSAIPKPGDGLHVCLLSYRQRTSLLFLWELESNEVDRVSYGMHVSSEERSTYQVWIRGRYEISSYFFILFQRNMSIAGCESSLLL